MGEDTTFSRILQMVEEAQDKKARTQKFLEVFSKYYTPSIIVLAALVFMITRDLELALTLLVIAVVITLIAGVLLKVVFLSSGMLIHEISVLLVIINAIRLLGYGKEQLGKL